MRTEALRPISPVERWFWIADQVSPLNVVARVRLTGHIPEGVLELPSIVHFGRDRDLWSIARQIHRSLGRRRRFGQHLSMPWGLRFICPTSAAKNCRTFRLIERNGPLNVGIWNIGRYEFSARIGDWQLSGAQFISGVPPFGYLAATVTTSYGELFWNFTYTDGAVSHRSAQRFADGCLQTLLRAIA
jgi:hypothetical protein